MLQYYYRGVASWDWFYPYHYAPMAQDMRRLDNIDGAQQRCCTKSWCHAGGQKLSCRMRKYACCLAAVQRTEADNKSRASLFCY